MVVVASATAFNVGITVNEIVVIEQPNALHNV